MISNDDDDGNKNNKDDIDNKNNRNRSIVQVCANSGECTGTPSTRTHHGPLSPTLVSSSFPAFSLFLCATSCDKMTPFVGFVDALQAAVPEMHEPEKG